MIQARQLAPRHHVAIDAPMLLLVLVHLVPAGGAEVFVFLLAVFTPFGIGVIPKR